MLKSCFKLRAPFSFQTRANRCSNKIVVFNSILTKLELVLKLSEFPTRMGRSLGILLAARHSHRAVHVSLCTRLFHNLGVAEHSNRLLNGLPGILRRALRALWYLCLSQRKGCGADCSQNHLWNLSTLWDFDLVPQICAEKVVHEMHMHLV